jgi:two-component system CheB/CheR fusion protein
MRDTGQPPDSNGPTGSFPIVGIGASAGGVDALEGFFRGMPENPGLACVVVTHLNPERESLLHEIIARYTDMPVHTAADGTLVAINSVHVLPADALLGIENGRLQVKCPQTLTRERKPIDIFFGALAKDQGEYAAAVVLSGGDGDGTLGVKAVKERGGLTMAQTANGHGPAHPSMPNSAIASGLIDFAIPAGEMGARLVEFARSLEMLETTPASGLKADSDQALDDARQEIYAIIHNQIGHDFAGYKAKTFLRRVQRRMQIEQIETIGGYLERLRQDPKEVNALFRDLLINVTNFFRDAAAFEKLAELVIPKLFEGRGANETVRVWIPGCATGEEVFSIAILLREHMDGLTAIPRVQVFATDIDEHALAVARAARYPEALLDSVTPERRRRFFIADGGGYVLSKDVRDMCIFSPHSVIRDPPFSRIDLVSCRNLLIYFGTEVQSQVIPTFHYALRQGGYLFLGTSENVSQYSDLFTSLDKKQRLFRKRDDGASLVRLPMSISGPRPATFAHAMPRPRGPLAGIALRQAVETQVLERFAPPHVVATREGDVVYYSARTGKYLEPAAGVPTRHLLNMARKGLRLDLRAVFREAVETDRTVIRQGLEIESDDGRVQMVTLTVEPIIEQRDEEPLFLVLFTDEGPAISREAAAMRGTRPPDGETFHLERELREARERLQSLVEEYETALEELKSSNEELVSVNEELQSTNEEMEASKEELQSLNEELHTVNAELNGKIEALDAANSDLQNLFESTEIATVFLDRKLVIRTFTPAVTRVFNILPSDRGRPLTDLSSKVPVPTLADDVRRVLATGNKIERRIDRDGGSTHFLMGVFPYRNSDTRIDGVVVTFIDVTTLTQAEANERGLIAELNHRVKNMLTVVIAIAEQTLRAAPEPDAFTAAFVPRLHAMARSYELLSRDNWKSASLDELARQALAPFGLERTTIEGPKIMLDPKRAISVSMILHELATNASKYGALSDGDGGVATGWSLTRDDGISRLSLTWLDRDGPQVDVPSKRGLGLRLIERETAYTLGGIAQFEFPPTGFKATIAFDLPSTDQGEANDQGNSREGTGS